MQVCPGSPKQSPTRSMQCRLQWRAPVPAAAAAAAAVAAVVVVVVVAAAAVVVVVGVASLTRQLGQMELLLLLLLRPQILGLQTQVGRKTMKMKMRTWMQIMLLQLCLLLFAFEGV